MQIVPVFVHVYITYMYVHVHMYEISLLDYGWLNLLKTSLEYTRAGVYRNCVL